MSLIIQLATSCICQIKSVNYVVINKKISQHLYIMLQTNDEVKET